MLGNNPLAAPMRRTLAWWLLLTDHGRRWTSAAISTVVLWVERSRSRRVLATLDDHQLRDVGISRADARLESAKPFWMPWTKREHRLIGPFTDPPSIAGGQPPSGIGRRR
jgi:uncharacterized protein YjiS (DUF1127 family)